jgi:hypothetical protein
MSNSGYWEYRVVREKLPGKMGDIQFRLVEAYFGADGRPQSYCSPHLGEFSLEILEKASHRLVHAFSKPVMDAKEFDE